LEFPFEWNGKLKGNAIDNGKDLTPFSLNTSILHRWHFVYIRLDAMVCGFFQLPRLPAASTFWRYVDNLSINQARSILKLSSALRERAWQLCALRYRREDRYTYRVFCTNLKGKPHKIIANYDKRADAENLIGEAKREGLDAIPSAKFKNNYAYFQIVMLAYNIWRYYKILAQRSTQEVASEEPNLLEGIQDNTIRIASLKLLLIAAKLAFHNNREQVKFSIHDSRTPSMQRFLRFLDNARAKARPWIQQSLWPCRFSVNLL
jgi:hypothetical protein